MSNLRQSWNTIEPLRTMLFSLILYILYIFSLDGPTERSNPRFPPTCSIEGNYRSYYFRKSFITTSLDPWWNMKKSFMPHSSILTMMILHADEHTHDSKVWKLPLWIVTTHIVDIGANIEGNLFDRDTNGGKCCVGL